MPTMEYIYTYKSVAQRLERVKGAEDDIGLVSLSPDTGIGTGHEK